MTSPSVGALCRDHVQQPAHLQTAMLSSVLYPYAIVFVPNLSTHALCLSHIEHVHYTNKSPATIGIQK